MYFRVFLLLLAFGRANIAHAQFYSADDAGRLWTIDLNNGNATLVGDMGKTMLDIAVSPMGEMYGIDSNNLYRINRSTGAPTQVGPLGLGSLFGPQTPNALEFDADGRLFYATRVDGIGLSPPEFGRIDLTTGQARTISPLRGLGDFGLQTEFHSAGDLAYGADGYFYMTECPPTGFSLQCGSTTNGLVRIDPLAAELDATLIGDTRFSRVYGLDFAGDDLLGTLLDGRMISIDITTGMGTALFHTDPLVASAGAAAALGTSIGPTEPPPVPRIEVPPVAFDPTKRGLVFITHGWNPLGPLNLEFEWVDMMADAIRTTEEFDISQWDVLPHQWALHAGVLPSNALINATWTGMDLGSQLAQNEYSAVHLIAHSAGAAMINEIAKKFRGLNNPPEIHTTFLDAYAPTWHSLWRGPYGAVADRADHYYFQEGLPDTSENLEYAHNVDVTELYAGQLIGPVRGHGIPREFYEQSITDSSGFTQNYGFNLSAAWLDEWDESVHVKNRTVELRPAPGESQTIATRIITAAEIVADNVLTVVRNAANTARSAGESIVDFLGDRLLLGTGSPAWITSEIAIHDRVDFLELEVEFLSEPGAEGVLAVYLNDQIIGSVDERFIEGSREVFPMGLPPIEPGMHTISFRLDPFTDIASQALISELRFGSVFLAGDANGDEKVDLSDFAILKENFGTTGGRRQGNFNSDEVVDLNDFAILKSNFGLMRDSNGVIVPEPSGLSYSVIAAAILFVFRRSRKQRPVSVS